MVRDKQGVRETASRGWNSASSMLGFEVNPRRGIAVVLAILMIVIAVILVLVDSVHSGGGCNAVLASQRYDCIASLAGQTGNALYCNQIGNAQFKDSCIMAVSLATSNVSACSAFPGGQERNNCIENVSLNSANPLFCDGLDSHNQSACRYRVVAGLNFSQGSYCPGIRNSSLAGLCTAQSYYHLALRTGNYSYCSDLSQNVNNTLVAVMGAQNPAAQTLGYASVASEMNTTPQDFCFASLATADSHASCSNIINSTLRLACDQSYATSLNQTIPVENATAYCSSGSTPQLQDICYFSIYANEALKTSNESWCGKITNQSYMASCIVNLASLTGNSIYCNSFPNSTSVQDCITEVSLANGANYT